MTIKAPYIKISLTEEEKEAFTRGQERAHDRSLAAWARRVLWEEVRRDVPRVPEAMGYYDEPEEAPVRARQKDVPWTTIRTSQMPPMTPEQKVCVFCDKALPEVGSLMARVSEGVPEFAHEACWTEENG